MAIATSALFTGVEAFPGVPASRLHRASSETCRGLRDRGLVPSDVSLLEGLLVEGGAADLRLYRVPLAVYHEAANVGLFGPDDRAELLDGLLVSKTLRNPPRVLSAYLTAEELRRLVPAGWQVKMEDPVSLPTGPSGHASEPEPDASVIRGSARDYFDRHPLPADMALVVEVSDTTLREDPAKLVRYAWENVPVVWIIDLNARRIEVHFSPTGPADTPGYREVASFGEGDGLPVVLDGREVGRLAAVDLLP